MTARAHINGHPVYFDEEADEWRWKDTRGKSNDSRPCARCKRRPEPIIAGRTAIMVDYCLAGVISEMNRAGITTLFSCCGHGIEAGKIALEDGREIVLPNLEDQP